MGENTPSTDALRNLVAESVEKLTKGDVIPFDFQENLEKLTYEFADHLQIQTPETFGKDLNNEGGSNEGDGNSDVNGERLLSIALLNLLKIYQNNIHEVSKAFGVNCSPNGSDLVTEIANKFELDPNDSDNNLSDQIFRLLENNNSQSHGNDDSRVMNISELDSSSIMESDIDDLSLQESIRSIRNKKSHLQSDEINQLNATLKAEREEKDQLAESNYLMKEKIKSLEETIDEHKHEIELMKTIGQGQNDSQQNGLAESIANMQKSVYILEDELNKQREEMTMIYSQKKLLMSAMENAIKIIDKYEQSGINPENQEDPTKQENLTENNYFLNDDEQDLLDSISEIVGKCSSDCINDILDISQEYTIPISDKIKQIVSVLIEEIMRLTREANQGPDSKKVDDKNVTDLLFNVVYGQLHFIDRLANTEEDRKWIKPVSDEEQSDLEFRESLVKQSSKINLFLEQYGKGIIENMDIFAALSLKEDPLQLESRMTEYLDNFPRPKTDDARCLMALLRQAFTACMILRRYAIESKVHVVNQANEIKRLQKILKDIELSRDNESNFENDSVAANDNAIEIESENNEFNIDGENEYDYETLKQLYQEEHEKAETLYGVYSSVINILRSSYSQNDLSKVDILEAIQMLQECYPEDLENNEYREHLENELSTSIRENERLQNELNKYKEGQLSEIANEAIKLREFSNSKLQQQQVSLEDANSYIAQIRQDNEDLKAELSNAEKDLEEARNTIDDLRSQSLSQQSSETLKKKLEKKLSKTVMAVQVQEKEKRDQLKARYRQLRAKHRLLVEQLSEKDRQIKVRETAMDQLVQEQKAKISRIRENEVLLQKTVVQLKSQLNEKTVKLTASEMERTVLNQKIKSFEERGERNKVDAKAMIKVIETEYNSKLEDNTKHLKEELENRHRNFVSQICNEFKGCFEIPRTSQLNDEIAYKITKAAAEMVKTAASDRRAAVKQLKELQSMFKVASTSDVSKAAVSYVAETKAKIETLQKQIESKVAPQLAAREWEEWAKKLYTCIETDQSTILSISQIKKLIQEYIVEKSGGSKSFIKTMESLRAQKILYKNHSREIEHLNRPEQSKGRELHVSSLILVIAFVRRVQKRSGTLPADFSISSSIQQRPDDDVNLDDINENEEEEVVEIAQDDANEDEV